MNNTKKKNFQKLQSNLILGLNAYTSKSNEKKCFYRYRERKPYFIAFTSSPPLEEARNVARILAHVLKMKQEN